MTDVFHSFRDFISGISMDVIWSGLKTTLIITIAGMLLGTLLAAGLCAASRSRWRILQVAELIETWLSDEALQQDPKPEDLEEIPDAETIRVGISGTLPPMDYATADGRPGGFNVALFGEISKLLGKNVEFVTVDPDAKFMALSSGTIDLFFWNFYGRFISEDYEISQPYLTDYGAFLIRAATE